MRNKQKTKNEKIFKKEPPPPVSRTEHVSVNNLMAGLNIAEDEISVLEGRSEEIAQNKQQRDKWCTYGKATERV